MNQIDTSLLFKIMLSTNIFFIGSNYLYIKLIFIDKKSVENLQNQTIYLHELHKSCGGMHSFLSPSGHVGKNYG